MDNTELTRIQRNRLIWRDPRVFIACGFGVGTLPIMPGTYGTALGVGLYLLLQPLSIAWFVGVLVLLFAAGVYLCGYANKQFGTDDHPAAVWDEVATFPWVMLAVPLNIYTVIAGFALFRLFDILKPSLIGWVDRNYHGGFGVMLDDWLAAIASCIVLHIGVLLYGVFA